MSERPNVVLLIETSNEYSRGLLRGIMAYIREHDPWSIYVPEQDRGKTPPGWLRRWHGDGIIARIETPQIARAVAGARLPAVDVSAARLLPGIPWVETDDEAFARAAVDHLQQRGFRHFGFCGEPRFNWSKWRREHFERMVEEAGGQCRVYESAATPGKPMSYQREHRRLVAWVRKLPKPIGVMACYDIKGRQLLDACREAAIAVPEEVAVIGVDNDELLCNLASPPLSSVIPNTHRTGYQAAAILARMMAGEELGEQSHRIPPLSIATRQSTDILAIDDPEVAAAVRYIRQRACEGINVADVLKEVPLTRRDLEHRFRKVLGCTPHEEIVRVRIDRVKHLLSETELPMTRVAHLAGYPHVEYLSAAFKKRVGLSPRAYRRTAQE